MSKKLGNSFAKLLALGMLALFLVPTVAAQEAPAKLQAAIIMKLLQFHTNLGDQPFNIHVMGNSDVANELKGMIGNNAGKATLNGVTESADLPSGSCQVLYVARDVQKAIEWSQANKVLTVTGNSNYVSEGVTLGIGVENNKPKILLNLSSSKAEDINWNPAILKVAKTL